MSEFADELRERTRAFAVRVIRLTSRLPRTDAARIIGRQVLRSGTSIGANYHSACRARSRAEFAARIGRAVEEADETLYWLNLLIDAGIVTPEQLGPLIDEVSQVLSILASAQLTTKRHPLRHS